MQEAENVGDTWIPECGKEKITGLSELGCPAWVVYALPCGAHADPSSRRVPIDVPVRAQGFAVLRAVQLVTHVAPREPRVQAQGRRRDHEGHRAVHPGRADQGVK